MIEPIASSSAKTTAAAEPQPVAARPAAEQPETTAAAPGATDVHLDERQKRAAPANPGFEVRLDGDTMRLYSELRDPATDRVILRLPSGYQPKGEQSEDSVSSVSTEA